MSSASLFSLRSKFVLFSLLFTATTCFSASEVWDAPAFSASPQALQQAAAVIQAEKEAEATVLLHEERYTYDRDGRLLQIIHTIYRIENEEGVNGWAETNAQWEPWHEFKPEVRARVITPDGTVHQLDPKTLNDLPVHEDTPDTYTDVRAFGGPLPAIAIGAIVEEEIVVREKEPSFRAGTVQRLLLDRTVPLHKSRVIISHPDALLLHYKLVQMPGAHVSKNEQDGIETIEIEDGPYDARSERLIDLPSDVPIGPEVEFSTGSSWQAVAQEYGRLSNEKVRTSDVQAMTAKIGRSGSRQELIRRIVAGLHRTVRYTGVEFGESSLVPQFPAETLKRKYGDCKDKATLLVTLLRSVNITANLALLSTGPGQDINTELPGMGMFDHAIVYLPATGTEPEMWIDATAQYSRVGDLPEMDYGRWALVIDENTTSLRRIPELTAEQNFHREIRQFTLADFGQAVIRETDEQRGPREAKYRSFYNGDAKQVREASEKYVKNAYLADSLIALEHGDLTDLEKPFSVTYVTKGKRGNTDFENALVAIRLEDLMDNFPDYFTTAAEPQKGGEKDDNAPKRKPRSADWQITPFINEWDYKIIAPPGYRVRALPAAKDDQVGSAHLTQKYSSNPEGTIVEAVLRFESGKPRLTVKEAEVLRDAVVKARAADAIFITFDNIGHTLMAAGKVKEGLTVYRQLAAQRPKDALPRIQLAQALLSAGLAEKARAVAVEATVLDPNSAQAFKALGWILQHDVLGRRFKKGFDYAGAVNAYRKAKALDLKDVDIRADLAILLEYDANGERYAGSAHLKEAINEFKELKKLDEEVGRKYDDYVIYDLWYSRDFPALKDTLKKLAASEVRRGFMVALTAVEEGSEAALNKSLEVTTSESERKKVLTNAGWMLLYLRKYSESADLMIAGARGGSTETQMTAFATSLKKARPREAIKIDENDPRNLLQRCFAAIFSTPQDFKQIRGMLSERALRGESNSERQGFVTSMYLLRKEVEKSGVPFETIGDIALSNMRYTVEGSDAEGYRVTVESPGAQGQDAFIVRENGSLKLLAFSSAGTSPEELGWQALDLLEKNDLPAARKWLDWAREKIHMSGNDDPLAVQPFPYFWTKGQEGDGEAIRTAALVLLPSKALGEAEFKGLLAARDRATTDQARSRLDLVVASAYAQQERWEELLPVADRLLKAFPDSLVAFHFVTRAYANMLRLSDWEQLVQERLAKHPDELDYVRSAADLARYRGDFGKSRQLIKPLIDRSRATQDDLNQYAWDALFMAEEVGPDSIEAAERGNQLTKNSNFAVMHTLACLYAHTGKAAEARELVLKAMEQSMDEPDSAIWVAYGQIAEEYGERDSALTMYARVGKQPPEAPTSNYALAQRRLMFLKTNPVTSASSSQ